MNPMEQRLQAQVSKSRDRLVRSAEHVGETVKSKLDVLRPVRRNPLTGVLASLSAGILVGAARAILPVRNAAGDNTRKSLGSSLLPSLASRSAPMITSVISNLLTRFWKDSSTRK